MTFPQTFPDVYYTTNTYNFRKIGTDSVRFTLLKYTPSNLYGVDSVGNNAQGAIDCSTIWQANLVLGLSYKVTFINAHQLDDFLVMTQTLNRDVPPTSSDQMITSDNTQYKLARAQGGAAVGTGGESAPSFGGGGSATKVIISGYTSAQAVLGESPLTDHDYIQYGTGAPAKMWYFYIGLDNFNTFTEQDYKMNVELRMYTKWFRKHQNLDPDSVSAGGKPIIVVGNNVPQRVLDAGIPFQHMKNPADSYNMNEAPSEEVEMVEIPLGPAVKRRIVPSRV